MTQHTCTHIHPHLFVWDQLNLMSCLVHALPGSHNGDDVRLCIWSRNRDLGSRLQFNTLQLLTLATYHVAMMLLGDLQIYMGLHNKKIIIAPLPALYSVNCPACNQNYRGHSSKKLLLTRLRRGNRGRYPHKLVPMQSWQLRAFSIISPKLKK